MNERRSVKFAGIRFTDGEYASIQAAIMSSGLDASKWLRNRILNTPLPGSASIPPSIPTPQAPHDPYEPRSKQVPTPPDQARRNTHSKCSGCNDYFTKPQLCKSCSEDKETPICLNCCEC